MKSPTGYKYKINSDALIFVEKDAMQKEGYETLIRIFDLKRKRL